MKLLTLLATLPLAAQLALAGTTLAAEPTSRATTRPLEDVRPATGWTESALSLEITRGADGASIGGSLDLEVRSLASAYLVVLQIDAHGGLELLAPGRLLRQDFVLPGAPLAIRNVELGPPVGPRRIYAIATREALPRALGLHGTAPLRLADREASGLVSRLADTIESRPAADVAFASLDFEVLGRGAIEYTIEDVVAHLTPTRSIPRPRIDLHGVQFEFDSRALSSGARANLDVVGQALRSTPLERERFRLGGHSDALGPDDYNERLSLERADAARSYLVERWGVDPGRLEVVGYGESRPLAQSGDPASHALNRRVELEVLR